jgi:hypothetical protein
LLPLAYLVCAATLARLVRIVPADRWRLAMQWFVIIAVGPAMCFRVLALNPREFSTETGTLYDAEAVVSFLGSALHPEDYVVSIVPSTAPLIYQARRQALPIRHFESTGNSQSLASFEKLLSDKFRVFGRIPLLFLTF